LDVWREKKPQVVSLSLVAYMLFASTLVPYLRLYLTDSTIYVNTCTKLFVKFLLELMNHRSIDGPRRPQPMKENLRHVIDMKAYQKAFMVFIPQAKNRNLPFLLRLRSNLLIESPEGTLNPMLTFQE